MFPAYAGTNRHLTAGLALYFASGLVSYLWISFSVLQRYICSMRKIIYSELPFRRSYEGVTAPINNAEFYHEITKTRAATST